MRRFYRDNTGVNIAEKIVVFVSLQDFIGLGKMVSLKNNQYVGLVHYRRYFAGKKLCLKKQHIASERELLSLLEKYDAILPKKTKLFY